MKVFITAMMLWISNQTGYAIPEHPNIRYVTTNEMKAYAYGCDEDPIPNKSKDICAVRENWDLDDWSGSKSPIALYDHKEKLIILNKDFNIETIHDQSVLFHELVHHLQSYAGKNFEKKCRGDLEKEAYDLQNIWLKEKYNTNVYDTIGINELFLILLTSCGNPYHIPPDPEYQNQHLEK
tara:strand:- start:2927 stop:3466 length:540 start_codon:yes stop_codon:yes gene_type:complete